MIVVPSLKNTVYTPESEKKKKQEEKERERLKKMKSVNEDSNGSNSNNNNWLGFSLSPHMKMEVSSSNPNHHHRHHHHHQYNHQSQLPPPPPPPSVTSIPTSFYLSPSRLNSSLCYGVGENGGGGGGSFHPPLSVMPLKSDGSLCIMEALTRSQPEAEGEDEGMVQNSSPKLENFLGGATMAAHQYERETMALSLDSMYYQQLSCNGMYQAPLEEESRETQLGDCETQIPIMGGDGLRCVKNWVSSHHSDHRGLDQQMCGGVVDDGGASGSGGSMGCGDLQSLSLSMSPGSQSSCVTAPRQISPTGTECLGMETKKRGCAIGAQKQPVHRKSIDTFGQRTSQFRGVTRHRWTGRYEAHLWDNSCKKEGQTRKGRQVYLGGYDMEEKAARAYDLAALKYWGPSTHINFPLENYQQELEEMKNMNRQEFVAHLRRKSSGFSRGASMYRGVTRHHQHGRWQARIGRVAGNKDLYLGTFSTQEEAAEAYDIAAIKFRGVNAVTNFDISRYEVERIMASNTLLTGDLAKRNKQIEPKVEAIEYHPSSTQNSKDKLVQPESNNRNGSDWGMVLCQSPQEQQIISRVESLNEKLLCIGNYRNSSFSMALQDLVGIDSTSSSQTITNESATLGSHFSNHSSLVAPLRAAPPISMAHFPVFAAWNDA